DKKLSGVCGGLAEYMNVDATIVRLLYVFLTFFTGFFPGIILYVVAALIAPKE
ncbi:MAG: PspC domain-containing protein, partial [Bacteroidaceae bacterium]|nr:PspC domain-containing protein [Bacteroidaceae bacterium]